ncbi:MAG: CHASE domain-containing protein [Hahellaceae bacterium]|nr:CHASE domain-containing protein [Hahellaceae bacterium]
MRLIGPSALLVRPHWVVLVISLSITVFSALNAQRAVEEANDLRFARYADQLVQDISSRMATYIGLLKGGMGLFQASEHVTRSEWKAYVEELELANLFPGIQGIGFAQVLAPSELQSHEETIRAEGFADYEVHPAGPRDLYTAILYLEPFDWRNQRAFGYDMYSEPVRQAAMVQARDSGLPSTSGKVQLVQETETDQQPGFVIYLPVYDHHSPRESAEDRSKALQGYVYSPFRMDDLINGILPNKPSALHFQIYDESPLPENLLYSQEIDPKVVPTYLTLRRTLKIGGRVWVLDVRSTSALGNEDRDHSVLFIIAGGCLSSALLFLLTLTLSVRQQDAVSHSRSLREQLTLQKKLNLMTNLAPTPLISLDIANRVEFFNVSASRMFGHQLFQGATIKSLIPGIRLPNPDERAPIAIDTKCINARGDILQIEFSIQILPMDDGSRACVCSIVDISSRKTHEALLEKKSRELEQFVYAVSHDLRAPLVSLRGFGELLKRMECLKADPKAVHYVHRILANVESMDRLLSDLLALSRIGHKPLNTETIDLNELLAEVLGNQSQDIRSTHANIHLPPDLPSIQGQRSLIYQLFSNLLSNALKYRQLDRPPEIGIAVEATTPYRVTLSFTDNGIGIEPRFHARIFDIFERLDTERSSGSGVGLTICKAVIEKHGGKISLSSTLGQGTRFTFDLPLIESQET